MKVIDLTMGVVLAENVKWARSFLKRLKGLMFKNGLEVGEGIILFPCNSIHTFFMRFPIDLLFLDKEKKVIRQIEGLGKRKILAPIPGARYVVELPSGSLREYGCIEGHAIAFE